MDYEKANARIEEVMNSLTGLEQAEPDAYLLTRINGRLNNRKSPGFWPATLSYLGRPLIAGLALMIFLFVNILVIGSLSKDKQAAVAQSSAPAKYDFAINVYSMYDFETNEP